MGPLLFDIAALTMKYFFDQFDFESGGALAALMLGLVVKEFWRRQWPRCLALQVGRFRYAKDGTRNGQTRLLPKAAVPWHIVPLMAPLTCAGLQQHWLGAPCTAQDSAQL